MTIKTKAALFFLINLFLLSSCEYERLAAPEPICESELLILKIESVENTACDENSGEIQVEVEGDDIYEYSLNDSEFSSDNVFTDLTAGTYRVQARIKDTNCLSDEVEATVNNEDGLQIELAEKVDSECGVSTGSILISQTGGEEPIEYILNDQAAQNDPEFQSLSSGTYSVRAIDANGCEAEISGIELVSDISFANTIQPLIRSNCAVSGCHDGTQSPNFSVDANILQNASRIEFRVSNETMPPSSRPDLAQDEIDSIVCWVESGALDN